MDEIIEELRALNVEVLSPLELPDDEDILEETGSKAKKNWKKKT